MNMVYYFELIEREAEYVAGSSRQRKEKKTTMVARIVSLALAVLMVLSVVFASIWRW